MLLMALTMRSMRELSSGKSGSSLEYHVPLSCSKLRLPVYLKLSAVTESASSVNTAEPSVSSLPVFSSGFSFDAAKAAAHTTMSTPRRISSFFALFICASF